SDATGWMGAYALAMCAIAAILRGAGKRPGMDLVLKFLEHLAAVRAAMDGQGMWDEGDGLFYDKLVTPDGAVVPVKVRSMVGIIPVLAAAVIDEGTVDRALSLGKQSAWFLERMGLYDPDELSEQGLFPGKPGQRRLLLGLVRIDRLQRLFGKLFDEREFLSPYGLRSISAFP